MPGRKLHLRIPDDNEGAEEFILTCCELMPEERVRYEVGLLKPHGFDLATFDDYRAVFRLACVFDVPLTLMFVRLLQVYPDLKKRLAI